MNSDRTQTGIPIVHCPQCRLYHPQGRRHCTVCGKPTLFITPNTGNCLKCGPTTHPLDPDGICIN